MMDKPGIKSETRALAERLVAFEAAYQTAAGANCPAECRVCEKLRLPLVTLTGSAGFNSLLSRALTLASRDTPALRTVLIKPDGSLEGMAGETALAHTALVAQLLNLLFTFIGESLTMRLLHDIWPTLPELGLNSLEMESK